MYNKVTAEDIAALQAVLGEADVIFGDAVNPDYSHDELGGISRMPDTGGCSRPALPAPHAQKYGAADGDWG